jgi:hypothetical protein
MPCHHDLETYLSVYIEGAAHTMCGATVISCFSACARLIAEQEQLTSRLHEEANSLKQSAAEAVEGVQGTIAEVVRSVIIDEASLTMLAAEGELAPHDRLREVRAANERMLAAQAEERRARFRAEALMLRMAPILPAIASDHDTTPPGAGRGRTVSRFFNREIVILATSMSYPFPE